MTERHRLMRILQAPIISEKSTAGAELYRRFAFRVDKKASKLDVKSAVEVLFDVKVETVQMLNVKGKLKRSGRHMGKRSDWKKAYVKLKPGFDIDFAGG